MDLRLQYPPIPENAARHAELAANAAWNVDRIKLDFSPRSLTDVDAIIVKFHSQRLTEEQIGSTVFSFGCYAGEVLVRHHGGVWKMPADAALPDFLKEDNNMMVVELPNETVWNPIGKAFKLLENGETDSLTYFYHVATQDNQGNPRRPWWRFWK